MAPWVGNPKDFWTGVIYTAVGVCALVLSRDYGMGNALRMGPAYFPTVLAAVLVIIGCVSIVRSFVRRGTPIGQIAWKGLLLVVAATLSFGLILRGAGLVVALPLVVVLSALASVRFSWKHTLLLALGVTVFCVVVFQIGLGVPMPILGSWFGG